MSKEDDLQKKLEYYQELAKNDKNIDISALMLNEFQTVHEDDKQLSHSSKRWGYTISLLAPPFGFIFAVKFWFSGKEDGRTAALICIALTVFSLTAITWFMNSVLAGVGFDLNQLEEVQNTDFESLLY